MASAPTTPIPRWKPHRSFDPAHGLNVVDDRKRDRDPYPQREDVKKAKNAGNNESVPLDELTSVPAVERYAAELTLPTCATAHALL